MKNKSVHLLAVSAVAVFMSVSAFAGEPALTAQSIQGEYKVNGISVFADEGQNILYQGGSDSRLYGDAATGGMALDATSITYGTARQVDSSLIYHATFANTGTVAQEYNFNFTLNEGKLLGSGGGYFNSSYGVGLGRLTGSVLINGAEAWNTSAECSSLKCTSSGVNIGYAEEINLTGRSYTYSNYLGSVSLGLLNPGQSVDIEYVLNAHAASAGLGVGEAYVGPYSAFLKNDFASLGGVSVSAVPEPQPVMLLAAGLGLLGFFGRRKVK